MTEEQAARMIALLEAMQAEQRQAAIDMRTFVEGVVGRLDTRLSEMHTTLRDIMEAIPDPVARLGAES